jgi:MFS family permease
MSGPANAATARGRTDLVLLLASSYATAASNSLVFASMSELQDRHGYGDAALGLIAGTGFAAGLVVQLLFAPLADRGHGRGLVRAGLALAVLGSIVFAAGDSLAAYVLGRAIVGASIGCVFPAVRALAAHLDAERSAERLGAVAGIEIAGFVSGPLLGSLLIGPLGLDATFLAFAGLGVVALVAVGPRQFPELDAASDSSRAALGLLRLPEIRVAVLLVLAATFPTGMFDALWDRFIADLGGSNAMTGLTFLVYGVPFVLLAPLAGRLVDRRDPVRVGALLLLPVAACTVGYGLLGDPWHVLALGGVEGVAQSLATPAVYAAVAAAAPAGRASAAQGLAGSVSVFGSMVAAFGTPAIYGAAGAAATFILVAGGILVAGAVALAMRPRGARRRAFPAG